MLVLYKIIQQPARSGIVKIFQLVVTFLVTKFLPHMRLVGADQVQTNPTPHLVPSDLDTTTLVEAMQQYKFYTGRLNARGQVIQLFHSENRAFFSLAQLAYELAHEVHYNTSEKEKECTDALNAIMREVKALLEKASV